MHAEREGSPVSAVKTTLVSEEVSVGGGKSDLGFLCDLYLSKIHISLCLAVASLSENCFNDSEPHIKI